MEGTNTIEKIYCCDNNSNNGWWPFMAGNAFGNNNWNDNPILWLFFLMFAQRNGWDMNGNNPQVMALQNQMQDNQNANLIMDGLKGNATALATLSQNLNCDFRTLEACCCDVKQQLATIGGQIGFSAERVINAVQMGNCNVIQAIQNCCCQTQKAILEMGYQNQLAICGQTRELRDGQRDLGVAITQGFSQVGFQAQQDKCEIIRAGEVNTQRIIDTMQAHWADEKNIQITDLKNKLANAELYEKLRACGVSIPAGCGCGI